MCIGSQTLHCRTVFQNRQDKTPKASPNKPNHSIHHNPGKQASCHSSNLLRYIRSLDWARIISLTSTTASTTPLQDLPPPLPLLLLQDVPCPDVKAVPVLPCLCPPRGLQTFTSKSPCPSRHARKRPLTFTIKSVTSQDMLASAPSTFTRKSSHLSRCACKCTIDIHS